MKSQSFCLHPQSPARPLHQCSWFGIVPPAPSFVGKKSNKNPVISSLCKIRQQPGVFDALAISREIRSIKRYAPKRVNKHVEARVGLTFSLRLVFLLCITVLLASCASTGAPKGIKPVQDFELERYLGTWYEIARLDHRFERGLTNVTATYSLNDDGSVRVVNSGVRGASLRKAGERKQATGKAKFVGAEDIGHLKVSFFGPIYGGYIVFALDQEDYSYSLVAGPNRKYLWVLSRTPRMDDEQYQALLSIARDNGYDTDKLIAVVHD